MFDDLFPWIVIGGLIAIALFGGIKTEPIFVMDNTVANQTTTLQTQNQIASPLSNSVTLQGGSYTSNADQEYIEIIASSQNKNPIDITGWQLTNSGTHYTVTIPQSVMLYNPSYENTASDVWLYPGEKAYIISGHSPLGTQFGFRANICSGYLTHNTTFTPYLYTSCPSPKQESLLLSATPANNTCFDLINGTAACTTRSQALDNTYTAECQTLFSNTLTYRGCVDKHQKDNDFYSPNEWYVYLNRNNSLWNGQRESIILTDTNGKVVSTISR